MNTSTADHCSIVILTCGPVASWLQRQWTFQQDEDNTGSLVVLPLQKKTTIGISMIFCIIIHLLRYFKVSQRYAGDLWQYSWHHTGIKFTQVEILRFLAPQKGHIWRFIDYREIWHSRGKREMREKFHVPNFTLITLYFNIFYPKNTKNHKI